MTYMYVCTYIYKHKLTENYRSSSAISACYPATNMIFAYPLPSTDITLLLGFRTHRSDS